MNNFTKRRVPKNMLQKSFYVPTLKLKNISIVNTFYNGPNYKLLTLPTTMEHNTYKARTCININLE